MTFSLADVDQAVAALRPREGVDLTSAPRGELMALLREASQVKAAADRLVAGVAGEIARRSNDPAGLARREGFASAPQLVASVTGTDHAQGVKLVAAGTAASEDRPLAAGLAGGLTVAKAALISSTLDPLEGDTRALEERLVRAARRMDYRTLKLACQREAARFDAAQTERRERRQHEQRGLDVTEGSDGMIRIRGQLPTVHGAVLITYLDAQVKAAFQARRDTNDNAVTDSRTATQIRADALLALAAHGLDCEAPGTGVKASIIVRVNQDDLDKQSGIASCDALSGPISLNALRQLAMDASIMRMVVDAKSRVLDFGHEHRLFNWAQRMALAERDGGCARCHAPISHCIAHHIRWWKRDSGPTDISNGVLLCVRCHTDIHRDNWQIDVDEDNHVWFTPPKEIDPERRRILGGLAALAVA